MKCECGKELDKVPEWMSSINVQFICNNCPSRTVQSIAEIKLEPINKEEDTAEKETASAEEPAQEEKAKATKKKPAAKKS